MYKRKLLLLAGAVLPLLMGVGCEKDNNPKYEIYENHQVSACGVDDPLKNIQWLKDYVAANFNAYSTNIFIYKDKNSETNYFVIETNTDFKPDRSPSSIKTTSVYTCSGERILFYGTEGPIPSTWDEFFQQNEKLLTLWSIEKLN